MRILRIVYDWPPPWDGLAPHPYEITKAQVKMGHTVDVFCGNWPKSGNAESPAGVTVHTFFRELIPGSLIVTNALWMFFYYLSWRQNNKVDIIHIHGHFGFWIYLYRKFLIRYFPNAKELKTPLVAHFHNTVAGRAQKLEENGSTIKPESKYFSWPLAQMSDKNAVEVAYACIFVSNENLEQAVSFYGADRRKCFVVETGVNTDLFAPIGGEEFEKTRRDLGLDLQDKIILNNGAMVERKNIHLLILALKFLPDNYKLFLVGPGDPAYLDHLDVVIKENNLKGRIVRVGYTPYPEVQVAFQAADLFVLPSAFEGLPKVVMQSIACGVPVLASGFKLSEEIRGLFYLENLEPENIAKQIISIVDQKPTVDVSKIVAKYSWNVRAREIQKVYEFATKE
jgi:glycosyltransferase involved in cell wall biosynthesis